MVTSRNNKTDIGLLNGSGGTWVSACVTISGQDVPFATGVRSRRDSKNAEGRKGEEPSLLVSDVTAAMVHKSIGSALQSHLMVLRNVS